MLYLRLIILLIRGDIFADSETFLMTDFMNFKIKPVQSFRYAHKDMMYVHVLCVFIYV
jgi:hypothetical protein